MNDESHDALTYAGRHEAVKQSIQELRTAYTWHGIDSFYYLPPSYHIDCAGELPIDDMYTLVYPAHR
uniref:Uncharacterized protein n=1 Tax=Setaria italica TaxID=4555 RepID=K3ZYU3_SETIT